MVNDRMLQTVNILKACKYAYYCKSESLMSDNDFDVIENYFKAAIEADHPYNSLVGFSPENFTPEVQEAYNTLTSGKFVLWIKMSGDVLSDFGLTQVAPGFNRDGFFLVPCIEGKV